MSPLEIGLILIILAVAGAAVWYTLRSTPSSGEGAAGSVPAATSGKDAADAIQRSAATRVDATPAELAACARDPNPLACITAKVQARMAAMVVNSNVGSGGVR